MVKKLSRTIFSVVLVLSLATTLNAHAQTFTLTNHFVGPTAAGSRAVGWKVGVDTINVQFTRRYNNNPDCETNYSVRFKFSDGFRSFRNGQKFVVEAVQLGGVAPCGMKKSLAFVSGPSVPANLQPVGWENNGNMRVTGYGRDWHGKLRLYSLDHGAMYTHMEAIQLKDVKQTAIVLDAAGNRLYLMYAISGSKDQPPESNSLIQNSTFGVINWSAGWYGNPSKTIRVTNRRRDSRGRMVVTGVWGRSNSARTGGFEFVYSDQCTFKGVYWEGNGSRKTWNGTCGK